MNGGNGVIQVLNTNGEFHGSLNASAVARSAYVPVPPSEGNLLRFGSGLYGDINITDSFTVANDDPNQIPPLGPTRVELPFGGLVGQININTDLAAGAVWDAPVYLGPENHPDRIILNTPGYAPTANEVGGGSVGFAPFDLHDEACQPRNGGNAANCDGDDYTVRLRHYGAISILGAPVKVWESFDGTTWTCVSRSVSWQIAPDDPNTLEVTGPFRVGYLYKIEAQDDLRCSSVVAGSPPVLWATDAQHDYLFCVEDDCPADLTGDGWVDGDDLFILLGAWGACPVGDPCPADLTGSLPGRGNNVVNADDLFFLLGEWGECCPTGGGMGMESLGEDEAPAWLMVLAHAYPDSPEILEALIRARLEN